MALSRLKQPYGVPGGLTTEPIIVDICKGPVVSFNVEALKVFKEELNILEVFAYAHDEYERLSGQLYWMWQIGFLGPLKGVPRLFVALEPRS